MSRGMEGMERGREGGREREGGEGERERERERMKDGGWME